MVVQNRQIVTGKVYSINDARTRGHKSLITYKEKNGVVAHIPTTHSPETRHIKNILLNSNFDKNDKQPAYILPIQQYTVEKYVGKYYPDLYPRNSQDKAVIRHIKKQKKR